MIFLIKYEKLLPWGWNREFSCSCRRICWKETSKSWTVKWHCLTVHIHLYIGSLNFHIHSIFFYMKLKNTCTCWKCVFIKVYCTKKVIILLSFTIWDGCVSVHSAARKHHQALVISWLSFVFGIYIFNLVMREIKNVGTKWKVLFHKAGVLCLSSVTSENHF